MSYNDLLLQFDVPLIWMHHCFNELNTSLVLLMVKKLKTHVFEYLVSQIQFCNNIMMQKDDFVTLLKLTLYMY